MGTAAVSELLPAVFVIFKKKIQTFSFKPFVLFPSVMTLKMSGEKSLYLLWNV